MTSNKTIAGAALGAVGSAAIAAALLYANKRRKDGNQTQPPPTSTAPHKPQSAPAGAKPETD